MKKSLIAVSLLAALSTNAFAAEEPEYKKWIAGFVEIYKPDEEKSFNFTSYDPGYGYGVEYGFRGDGQWGGRIEYAKINLESDTALADDTANRIGADAMYFLEDDLLYIFGGIKHINMEQGGNMASLGLGKHFELAENFKLITEAAAYHDFGESWHDVSLKVGLAYAFGAKSGPKPVGDSDQDGVNDTLDQCPNTPIGARVDSKGCSIDSDGDGVLNDIDQCPNTPAGTPVGVKGCSLELDMDQDGVLDNVDKCANTPMTDKVDSDGCSVFEEVEVRETLKVLFGNNSDKIENPDDAKFQEFADFMNRFPNTSTVIEGHASAPGKADYNMSLSLSRAKAVRQLLISKYGINAARITAEGFGETQLLDTSNTVAANKINRRIEAVVTATKKEKVKRN
ncbi:OmpA family protein [Aliiglaciecola sp. LCG003]|uniref:OmpA family protein n=1 Tax=Aliiglaciecola sp. LCG003 TaxID=3053655 RepID=UPI002573E8B6|nr:OmpA family protein [Aliiglaciecola sp. LCG003]WJG09778.1 OmpA family protein [Aliiglaciecola sp. LCG003]